MTQYILALDQGTTSSRAIVFDKRGQMISVAQKEFTQIFPQPGWVEHDPAEIWSTQIGVAAEAIMKAGLTAKDIAAIGITNQRETTIVWDRATGKAIGNAIVWQDRRTASLCEAWKKQGLEPMIRDKTGLVLDAYFSGTKIKWMLDHIPGAREKANAGELAFGTVDSWLLWNLTAGKVHATDVSNASRTLLFNLHTQDWDNELLTIFDIPRSMLPEIRSNSEVYGYTQELLSSASIPVAGMAGDQQSALFGQLCHAPGMVKNTYGTGCFMLMHTGNKPVASKHNLLTTVAWKINGEMQYALEGSVFIAGAVVQWLRDGLKIIRESKEIEALAASVDYLVPAFAGLGAPHWEQHARGTILGITRGSEQGHIARAALESIAYQTRDVLVAMEGDSGIPIKELRVDGGATVNNALMQFQSDMLDVTVVRPKIIETTALGAAYLAGLAVGYWESVDDLQGYWQADQKYTSTMHSEERQQHLKGWTRAVRAVLAWSKGED